MGGLNLGFTGGAIVCGATAIGAFSVFFGKELENPFAKLKLDFFIGLLLVATAFSNPSPLHFLSFLLGILFMKSSRMIIENIFIKGMALSEEQQKAVFIILLLMLKNIPEGIAAGATMNISHAGLGNSLLSAIVIQDLMDGTAAGLCFLSLGLSPVLAFGAATATGLIEFFSAVFGAIMSKEITELLMIFFAFSGGAMMSSIMEKAFIKAREESLKILLKPSFVSGMVVMLVFIFWKELL